MRTGVCRVNRLSFAFELDLSADNLHIRAKDPVALEDDLMTSIKTNIIGNVHLFNLFVPLILKGEKKKVIAISSGMADDALTAKYELEGGGPYSISKAGTNTIVAKFSAEYAKDGVLFMSICPGMVNTGALENCRSAQSSPLHDQTCHQQSTARNT